MHALHYQITLPADYDMAIIRDRVATRGHALDQYPGLRFKAYLIRERALDESPVNEYAPFYVWDDEDAMGRFLWGGDGFGSIVRDFGRPAGQTWTLTDFWSGGPAPRPPLFALKVTQALDAGSDPLSAADDNAGWRERQMLLPGIHTAIAAIDPRTWQLVRFTLWNERPAAQPGELYRVLHLSVPTIDQR